VFDHSNSWVGAGIGSGGRSSGSAGCLLSPAARAEEVDPQLRHGALEAPQQRGDITESFQPGGEGGPDALSDLGGGVDWHDTLVEVGPGQEV